MADDIVAIQGAQPVTVVPSISIKTFSAIDSLGRLVEIQGVALVDEFGRTIQPLLTESTGQAILEMLRNINNVMADFTGCGMNLPPSMAKE